MKTDLVFADSQRRRVRSALAERSSGGWETRAVTSWEWPLWRLSWRAGVEVLLLVGVLEGGSLSIGECKL